MFYFHTHLGVVMYRTVKDAPDQLKLQDDLNKMAY